MKAKKYIWDGRRALDRVLDWLDGSHYPAIPGFSPVRSYVVGVQNFLRNVMGIEIHPIGDTDEELARSFLRELVRVRLIDIFRRR